MSTTVLPVVRHVSCRSFRIAYLAGKLDVLERREVLNQIVELEHEADIQTTVLRELTFGESADLAPIKRDGAGRA